MKVIVLGSGVIGVTTAYYLARAGHEVTVIDRPSDADFDRYLGAVDVLLQLRWPSSGERGVGRIPGTVPLRSHRLEPRLRRVRRSPGAYPRVQPGVSEIDHQVYDHNDHREEENNPLNHWQVMRVRSVHGKTPEAR